MCLKSSSLMPFFHQALYIGIKPRLSSSPRSNANWELVVLLMSSCCAFSAVIVVSTVFASLDFVPLATSGSGETMILGIVGLGRRSPDLTEGPAIGKVRDVGASAQ